MKNASKYLMALSLVALLSACGSDENEGENSVINPGFGILIKGDVIDDIDASVMLRVVQSAKPDAQNAFGYKAVKITYNTVEQNGKPIVASGLLVIPTATKEYQDYRKKLGKKPFSVSMICENHGTIFTNAEAPTNVEITNGLPDHKTSVLMTGIAGFASVVPDYIGYGVSNGTTYHPYMLKKATAQSSLDMIKASIKYMEDSGVAINYQLYVSGYSQGGHAALALAQKVQEALPIVSLKGVAAMDGPYLVKSFGDAILKTGARMSVPAFMAYLTDSYTQAYPNITLDKMIQDSKIPAFNGLFDGTNDIVAIHTKLGLPPGAPSNALFKDKFINEYEADTAHKLKIIFNENNVGNFNALTKVNLIHCDNDDVIPVAMTYGVKQLLEKHGSNSVTQTIITDVNNSNGHSIHQNCASPAYKQAVGWFDLIRQEKI